MSLEKGVVKTAATGQQGRASVPRSRVQRRLSHWAVLQSQCHTHPQLCLCTASAFTPRLKPNLASSLATSPLACLAIRGPWPTRSLSPGHCHPDMTAHLNHSPAPSFQPCPMTCDCGGAGCQPGPSPEQDGPMAWPRPCAGLGPLAHPRPCHRHHWRPVCVPGDRPWCPGPALPVPWGATMAPVT